MIDHPGPAEHAVGDEPAEAFVGVEEECFRRGLCDLADDRVGVGRRLSRRAVEARGVLQRVACRVRRVFEDVVDESMQEERARVLGEDRLNRIELLTKLVNRVELLRFQGRATRASRTR